MYWDNMKSGFSASGRALLASSVFLSALGGQTVTISGFVDGSIAIPTASPINPRFSLDVAEIDFEKQIDEGISLRVDVDILIDSAELEQAYVSFWGISFGKFNAPIGFEMIDAPDMYQFSHSLVFDYALPLNLTGISYSRDFTQDIQFIGYVVNSDDIGPNLGDNPILGGRLGYGGIAGVEAGLSAIFKGGLSAIFKGDGENIIDFDATITRMEKVTIGLEVNQGGFGPGELGYLLMVNWTSGRFGVTFRQDQLGEAGTTTISPSFSIAEGALILFEYRSGTDIDLKSLSQAALEMTFTF